MKRGELKSITDNTHFYYAYNLGDPEKELPVLEVYRNAPEREMKYVTNKLEEMLNDKSVNVGFEKNDDKSYRILIMMDHHMKKFNVIRKC